MITQLGLLVLKTENPSKLAAFYSKLGLSFEIHKHGNGPVHFNTEVNGTIFEIYPLPKGLNVADKTTRLGFEVENLDKMIEGLEGVKIVKNPKIYEWGYSAIIEDLDGRKIELTESKIKSN